MPGTCPLLRAGGLPHTDYLNDPYSCMGDSCAWWVRTTEHPDCAIVVHATIPVTIDANSAFVEWIQRLITRRIAAQRPYPTVPPQAPKRTLP